MSYEIFHVLFYNEKYSIVYFFFFQAEDGIRYATVTGVQTCALPIVVDADRCSLFLVDRERKELWTKVAQGISMKEIRIPMDRGIAGAVAATNTPVNIPEAYEDPRFNQAVDKQTGYRTKSILCVPMRSLENDVVFVQPALHTLDGNRFIPEDEELLFALGGQAAA